MPAVLNRSQGRDLLARRVRALRKETNQCYTKNPEKGYEFIDWTFTVRGIELNDWYGKMGAMTQVLVDNTYLRAGDVQYLFADFTVDNGVSVMTAFSRCEVDTAFGEVIQRNFKKRRRVSTSW